MFGKKKKKNDSISPLTTNTAAVHTMQDDINSLNGTPQETAQDISVPQANPFGDMQQPVASPFPEDSSINEPLAAATIAKAAVQQDTTSEEISPRKSEIMESELDAASSPNNAEQSTPEPVAKQEDTPLPSGNQDPIAAPSTLDTSNPFADASSTPPAVAQPQSIDDINAAPEATAQSVATKAESLAATPTPPPSKKSPEILEGSPFMTSSNSTATNPFPEVPTQATPPTLQNEISKIQKEYGEQEDPNDEPRSKRSSCMSFIFIILIVLIIAGGGYYYWMSQSPDTNNTLVEIGKDTYNDLMNGDTTNDTETTEETETIEEYSETLPHYILLDTQSDTALEDFSTEIQTITTNITAQEPLGAISFIVTDESGAPLSFNRFALLTGITLSPGVLAQIDESFLLFGYYDSGNVRFGISAQTLTPGAAIDAMKNTEPTLVSGLMPLFAGEVPETTSPTFADGAYNQTPLRYANLNTAETLSVDYAEYSGDLVIGTSKGTIRAIIDTL